MRGGKLRHIVTIERRAKAFNNLGHQVTAWKPIVSGLRATVKTLSGRELELAKQQHAEATVSVVTRFTEAKTTDRFLYDGRVLEIASSVVDERQREATYLCSEHIAQ
jgi:SPP1 family predicted phage head-tail adaptor